MFGTRSSMHFAILLIVAVGVTFFVLKKAQEAVAEIRALQDQPIITARTVLEREEARPTAQ